MLAIAVRSRGKLMKLSYPMGHHSGKITALHAEVSGLIPDRVAIFNKEFLSETRRDCGAKPQSLVSVPNTGIKKKLNLWLTAPRGATPVN